MNTENTIINEEVVNEAVEEIVTESFGMSDLLKVGGVVTVIALAGYGTYKGIKYLQAKKRSAIEAEPESFEGEVVSDEEEAE